MDKKTREGPVAQGGSDWPVYMIDRGFLEIDLFARAIPTGSPYQFRALLVRWNSSVVAETWLPMVDKPISRKLETDPDPFWSEFKVDCTTELVRNQVTNCARPKTRFSRNGDRGSTDFLP